MWGFLLLWAANWHQLAECFDNLKTSSGTTRNQGDKYMQGLHCSTQGKESPGLQGFWDHRMTAAPCGPYPDGHSS